MDLLCSFKRLFSPTPACLQWSVNTNKRWPAVSCCSVIIPDVDSLIDSVVHTLESIFTGSSVFSVTSGSFLSQVDPLSAGVIPSEPFAYLGCW